MNSQYGNIEFPDTFYQFVDMHSDRCGFIDSYYVKIGFMYYTELHRKESTYLKQIIFELFEIINEIIEVTPSENISVETIKKLNSLYNDTCFSDN